MIRDDVLLRQLSQLAEAAIRVAGLVARKRHPEARQELDAIGQALLGVDLRLLEGLGSADLLAMVAPTGQLDLPRCLSLAELLRLAALVEPLPVRRARALELLATAVLEEPSLLPRLRADLEELSGPGQLPLGTHRLLYRMEAQVGDLGLAEDHAFHLLQRGHPVDLGLLEAALALPDEGLEERGLDRLELAAALTELRGLATVQA